MELCSDVSPQNKDSTLSKRHIAVYVEDTFTVRC